MRKARVLINKVVAGILEKINAREYFFVMAEKLFKSISDTGYKRLEMKAIHSFGKWEKRTENSVDLVNKLRHKDDRQ